MLFLSLGLLSMAACSGSRTPEGTAGAATTELAQQELSKLQGTWRIQSSTWNGVPESEVALWATYIFQGDKFIVVDRDGNRMEERIQIIPNQNPTAIDCWSKDGKGQPTPGIYTLEGDTLTWCSQGGGSHRTRPNSFSSEPGSKRSLLILKRESQ